MGVYHEYEFLYFNSSNCPLKCGHHSDYKLTSSIMQKCVEIKNVAETDILTYFCLSLYVYTFIHTYPHLHTYLLLLDLLYCCSPPHSCSNAADMVDLGRFQGTYLTVF